MLVSDVAKEKGITFAQFEQCFLDDYSTEDAVRMWNSPWKKAQASIMFYAPVYQLFRR